ncbi:MAG: hypothetical protein L3K17_08155 [Thermoplasmata archaeon]|nr:hypothetical protein [Thermoplasmata archaeon]
MMLIVAAVVVVVVVVLVLALALSGAIPGLGGSGNSSSSGQAFSQSLTSAQSASNGFQGGGYSAFLADGFASTTAVSFPTNLLTGDISTGVCTFTSTSSLASFTVPAAGNLSQGTAADWLFLMHNSAGGIIIVIVTGGSATVLGTLTGTTCTTTFSEFQALPSNMADSTTAALALDHAGGYAFLRAHSTAISSMGATGAISVAGFGTSAMWSVGYAGCNPSVNTSSAPEIRASVTANGSLSSVSNTTVSCALGAPPTPGGGGGGGGGGGTGGPLSSALSIGPATTGTEYTYLYLYNFTVTSATTGIEIGNLVASLTGAIPVPSASFVEVLSGSTPLGTYSFSSSTWEAGATTALSTGDVIQLTATGSVSGDTFVLTGTGGYTGTVTGSLP